MSCCCCGDGPSRLRTATASGPTPNAQLQPLRSHSSSHPSASSSSASGPSRALVAREVSLSVHAHAGADKGAAGMLRPAKRRLSTPRPSDAAVAKSGAPCRAGAEGASAAAELRDSIAAHRGRPHAESDEASAAHRMEAGLGRVDRGRSLRDSAAEASFAASACAGAEAWPGSAAGAAPAAGGCGRGMRGCT